MFIMALFVIVKNRNNPTVHQLMNGCVKCGIATQGNTIQPLKRMKY